MKQTQNKTIKSKINLTPSLLMERAGVRSKSKSYFGFTLVELIVVIVILAILATIAFLSFGSQSAGARNSTRAADINNITKAAEMFYIKSGSYPLPDNSFTVTYSGGIVWHQGVISDSFTKRVGTISKKVVDPLTSEEYDYSTLAYGSSYQIKADYEGDVTTFNNEKVINGINEVSAATTSKKAYIKGNYGGSIVKTKVGNIIYILAIPSIMSNLSTDYEIKSNSLSNIMLLNGQSSSSGITYNPNQVVFSGTVLPKDDTASGITNMMNNIVSAYAGTEVATYSPSIKEIVNTPVAQLVSMGSSMLSTQLGSAASAPSGGSVSGSGSGTGATGPTDDNWVNTTLLLHMDGANGGTSFSDQKGNTFVKTGTATTSTVQKKFGTASAYFDGSGGGVGSTLSTPINLGATRDFTVETWAYFSSFNGPQWGMGIINFGAGNNDIFTLRANPGAGTSTSLNHFVYIGGAVLGSSGHNFGTVNLNTWYHIAITRSAGVLYYFINGQLVSTRNTNTTTSFDFNLTKIDIGRSYAGTSPYMNGYIDEVRITNGVARYTSNFSLPTDAFPDNGGGTQVITTNGACGSDNGLAISSTPTNLCSTGNASSITGSGPWSWNCNGINGGTNASCVAYKSDSYWSNVSLLLHLDGSEGGTIFTDQKGNTFAAAGNAVTSTSQKKFGTSSAYFDGAIGGVSSTLGTPLNLTATGDFTIETWVYFNSFTGPQYSMPILGLGNGSSDIFLIRAMPGAGTSTSLNHFVNIGGSVLGSSGQNFGTVGLNQWYHIAVSRSAGVLYYFIDGQLVLTRSSNTTTSFDYNLTKVDIGKSYAGSSPYMNGYIDDVRITKGVARYTSTFTPSTIPFSNN